MVQVIDGGASSAFRFKLNHQLSTTMPDKWYTVKCVEMLDLFLLSVAEHEGQTCSA